MTTEELLMPRYKVIADYFYSPYQVGDLLKKSVGCTSFHCTTTVAYNGFTQEDDKQINYFSGGIVEKYSHLFRKMEWWGNRKEEDMPKYVKVIKNTPTISEGDVKKVLRWAKNKPDAQCPFDNSLYFIAEDCPDPLRKIYADRVIPATESEYLSYTNQ